MSKERILTTLSPHLSELKTRYHVKEIGVFGSAARGDARADSDIDIVVDFHTPIGFFEFIRLEDYLSGLLQRKVDLVSKRAIKPAVRDEILKTVAYV